MDLAEDFEWGRRVTALFASALRHGVKGAFYAGPIRAITYLSDSYFGLNLLDKSWSHLFFLILLIVGVLWYREPMVDEALLSLLRWALHDRPPPNPINARVLVIVLVQLASMTTGTMTADYLPLILLRHLLRLWPMTVIFMVIALFTHKDAAGPFRGHWWVGSDIGEFVLLWGVAVVALFLYGYNSPIQLFFFFFEMGAQLWPVLSLPGKLVFRTIAAGPWMAVYLVMIPFYLAGMLLWFTFRQPYFRVTASLCSLQRIIIEKPPLRKDEENYVYHPLAPKEIRLLSLRRNARREIECSLHNVLLNESPPFDAMSYRWGEHRSNRGIIIDGRWMAVTDSAHDLLQARASFFYQQWIWIDQISIDQQNATERAEQVRIMGDIYEKAARVVVWLGHSSDGHQTFSLLDEICERPAHANKNMFRGFFKYHFKATAARPHFLKLAEPDLRYAALGRLLLNEYFFRLWITQEIVLGRVVHVRCGGRWMEWDRFALAITYLMDPDSTTLVGRSELSKYRQEPSAMGQIHIIKLLRERQTQYQQEGRPKPRLCEVLSQLWMTRATDHRDMIYGLLALSREGARGHIQPDYTRDTKSVYLEVAQYLRSRDELVDIIHLAGIGYERKLAHLPSWVPDWSTVPTIALLTRAYGFTYTPAKGTTRDIQPHGSEHLLVKGTEVDEIADIMEEPFNGILEPNERPLFEADGASEIGMRGLFRENEAVRLMTKLPEVYTTGQSRREAFWRTLVGDVQLTSTQREPLYSQRINLHPAPPNTVKYFNIWMKSRKWISLLGITTCSLSTDMMAEFKKRMDEDLVLKQQVTESFEALQQREQESLFNRSYAVCVAGRKLAISKKGYMAMVPPLTVVGDHIVIFNGMHVPFILRKSEDDNKINNLFQLVGECYVHGIMDGEVLEKDHEVVAFMLH